MRIKRVAFVWITFFLMLQACGSQNGEEDIQSIDTPLPSIQTATEPTATVAPIVEFSSIPIKAGFGFRAGWLELYFTDPPSTFARENMGGLDGPVSAAIIAARESVDVAFNSLGVNSITQALIRAHERGIRVRVVIETNNMTDRANPQELKAAGIPIVNDDGPGVMNNRFIVIDNSEVWTGSLNYTSFAMFKQNNNLIRISSPGIAADYTKEFDEMFTNGQFGTNVVPETPNPNVVIEGTQVEVLFSPDDVVVARLAQLLGEAQQSIHFLAFSFDSSNLGELIRNKAAQGITIAGVMESTEVATEFEAFRQAGLDVRLGNASEVMNHKVIIIDGRIVILGSYDFTGKAENENDENVLIIHNEKVAEKFMEEFLRIQSRAQP